MAARVTSTTERTSPEALLACLSLALLLLGAIAWRGLTLLELRSSETLLGEAEQLVLEMDYEAALDALADLSLKEDCSATQKTRRGAAILELLSGCARRRHPIVKVGTHDFRDDSDHVYRSGYPAISVQVDLQPERLQRWVVGLWVGEYLIRLDDRTRSHVLISLPRNEELCLPVDLLVSLPGGQTAKVRVHEGLHLCFDLRRPSIELTGSKSTVLGSQNVPVEFVVPAGGPLSILVRDHLGLYYVTWSIDGVQSQESFAPESRREEYELPLPPDVTAKPGSRFVVTVDAVNTLGNESRRELQIRVPRLNPVERVLIGEEELAGDRTTLVGGDHATIEVELFDGEPNDDLFIRAGGKRYPLRGAGTHLEATIELAGDAPTGILVTRAERRLLSFQVQADVQPPHVELCAGEVPLASRPEPHRVPLGSPIRLGIRDASGLRRRDQRIEGSPQFSSLDSVAVDPAAEFSPSLQLAPFVPETAGIYTLILIARDRFGNATPRLSWQIDVRPILAVTDWSIGERRLDAPTPVLVRDSEVTLTIEGRGAGAVHVTVRGDDLEPRPPIECVLSENLPQELPLDLAVPTKATRSRRLEVRDDTGEVLAACELRVDREPPVLTLDDEITIDVVETPGEGLAICAVERDGKVVIRARDAEGLAFLDLRAPGMSPRRQEPAGTEAVVEIAVPAALPADMAAVAEDRAGNRSELRFRVVDVRAAAPGLTLLQGANPVVPIPSTLTLRQLDELRVLAEAMQIAALDLAGTPLGLPDGEGRLPPAPADAPAQGTLSISGIGERGDPVRLVVEVVFAPFIMQEPWVARLDELEASEEPRPALDALGKLEEEVRAAAAAWHNPGAELPTFRDRAARLRQRLSAESGTADDLSPTRTNPSDQAEMVLIRPGPDAPAFAPFYIYRSEVTVEMFRRFLEAGAGESAWWSERSIPGIMGKPENLADRARRSAVPTMHRAHPVRGLSRDVIRGYLFWIGAEQARGSMQLPTLEQWRLAAGRALHPKARFPTTGAFPMGRGLEGFRSLGSKGGAAIDGQEIQTAGSYAPGAFGLVDMAGNVSEWVLGDAGRWVIVGGSFASPQDACLLDHPPQSYTSSLSRNTGFRPVWIPGR